MTAPRTELEAAAFRALRDHLRARTDVQNIDLMNLAGFCRNCLSRWYQEAAAERGHRARQGRGARDRLRHALRRLGRARTRPRRAPRPRRSSPTATEMRAPDALADFVREALAGGGGRAGSRRRRAPPAGPRPRSRRRLAAWIDAPACRRCRGRAAWSRRATPSATG